MFMDSSQCPLSTHIVLLCITTNCKLLDAFEGNNKELLLKEELPSREEFHLMFLLLILLVLFLL